VGTVGRQWYVKIIAGRTGSQAFFGTAAVDTGDQEWHRLDWGTDMAALRESEVLDELWAACVSFMEARTHLDG